MASDPTIEHLTIIQGATFEHIVDLLDDAGAPRDLTGYSGFMQIYPRDGAAASELLGEADVTITAAIGRVTTVIPAAETLAYTWLAGVYDLIIEKGIISDHIQRGSIVVKPLRTR